MSTLQDKKILFITLKLGGGGAERVTTTLCNYMFERGYDVSVLAIDGNDGSYRMLSGLDVVCLDPKPGKIPGVVSRLVGIRRHVDTLGPDLIVNLGGGYRYVDQLRLYDRAELVFSERNYPPMVYGRCQMRQVFRLCSRASGVVFQTPDAQAFYPEDIQRKSAIIPNPVMDGLPEWIGSDGAEKRVVTFCRLESQKNLPLLIEAFALFAGGRHDDWRLQIFGDGSQRAALLKRAAELGIGDSVSIEPFAADVHSRVRNATMFVSSSDFEGLQNALIECMAMGMPCIATDCLGGGARMLAHEGERAMLVPRGSAVALADAMTRVADDSGVMGRLSSYARSLRDELAAGPICERWVDFLNTTLSVR